MRTTTLEQRSTSPWGPVTYRVYDSADRLIYVGSTGDIEKRLAQHAMNSWWASLAHRFDLEFHPNMVAAHGAETRAIAGEAPAFNLVSTGAPVPKNLALTADEQATLRTWAAANPDRASRIPQAFHWAFRPVGGAA